MRKKTGGVKRGERRGVHRILRVTPRSKLTRKRIVAIAIRHFAQYGYEAATTEDIAREAGISKGSIFQHYGTKGALFLEAYKKAASLLPAWLDAPPEVRKRGFFATLRHWLESTVRMIHKRAPAVRVVNLGLHGSDIGLRREIARYMRVEDPYGTLAFVKRGIARGELRGDLDPELIVSAIHWTADRFHDALLAGERVRIRTRIDQLLLLLSGAIGRGQAVPGAKPPRARFRRKRLKGSRGR